MNANTLAIQADVLHCLSDPSDAADAVAYLPNALLVIEDGHISALHADAQRAMANLPADIPVHDHSGKLLVPGFVDTHIHYPQVDIIASYGSQLLEWLERYTFPAETRFHDDAHAAETADFFLDQLLHNGTTTALVFGTVHPQSVDAFFNAASARSLRMICGKVMMDRNAPEALQDTAQSSYHDSRRLIRDWHGKERLGYAVTPRFAPTSSAEQLRAAGRLLEEFPDVHLHTHLAENLDECAWVDTLFPDSEDYLAVYEHFGLVRRRSVFAHSIHLSESAWQRMAKAEAAVSHCPTSNLFIGSGLFPMQQAQAAGVRIGLGTDVGGGDSFSILRTLNEAYKVQQLQQNSLSPAKALYLATLGGARALDLDRYIGNFAIGKEADLVILDESATPLLARRAEVASDWQQRMFRLMILGDDRCIHDTLIMGRSAKRTIDSG